MRWQYKIATLPREVPSRTEAHGHRVQLIRSEVRVRDLLRRCEERTKRPVTLSKKITVSVSSKI